MRTTPRRVHVPVLLAVLVLAGCATGPDEPAGPAVDVVTQVDGRLGTLGVRADPGSLTCAGTLAPRTGESVRCDFTSDGQPVSLVARAAAVDGARVDVEITTEARPVPKALLEQAVGDHVGIAMGATAPATTCDGDLQPQVAATASCTLTGSGVQRAVRVAVTAVDGGLIEYSLADS